MTIPPQFVLMIVLFGPGIIACYIFIKKIQQNRARLRESMDNEEPIKLPGHSVLEKIERTHEQVTDKIVFLIFPTILHACVFYMFFENRTGDEMTFVFLFGVETGIIALLGFKLWRLLKELEKYKMGYRGELFVSQILQPLSLMGYRIFHDLDLEGLKIDHLLINDSGVFCLETETPDIPKSYRRKKERELNYNGRKLQYPWGEDASCILTVQRNASTLARILREQTGEAIPVYPVLILPGWKINRTGKGPVNVVNPRELPAGLFYFPDFPMSERLMDKIEQALTGDRVEELAHAIKAS